MYIGQKVKSSYKGDETFTKPTTEQVISGRGNVVEQTIYKPGTTEVLNKAIYQYDAAGNVVESLGGNDYFADRDYTTKVEYNYMNLPVKEYVADGSYVQKTYDDNGRMLTETDYDGNVTNYEYDRLGRVIRVTAPFDVTRDSEVLNTYDNVGNVIKTQTKVEEGVYETMEYEYDSMNRLITQVSKGVEGIDTPIYTQYEYNAAGNVERVVTGHTEKATERGEIPDGAVENIYNYDWQGNVIESMNGEGDIEETKYDYMGNPISKTDRNRIVTTITYNGYGSPLQVNAGDEEPKKYTYNANNMLVKSEYGTEVTTYTYDDFGNVESEKVGFTGRAYTYDVNGNVTQSEISVNNRVQLTKNYTYNELNQVTNISFAEDTTADITYDYDDNKRLQKETRNGIITTYEYDKLGNVVSVLNEYGNSSNSDMTSYSYTMNGNQIQKSEFNGATTNYVYDGHKRLVSEETEGKTITYGYDGRGNRISMNKAGTEVKYTYDRNNRLLKEESETNGIKQICDYTYDNNGNRLSKQSYTITTTSNGFPSIGIADEENPYAGTIGSEVNEYNTFNQLIQTTRIEGDKYAMTNYTYDINGRRNSKTVNGVTTKQIWDGSNIALETNGSYKVKARYYKGIHMVAIDNVNSTGLSYYSYDAHGDIKKLLNPDMEVVADYTYDAFGNQTNTTENNIYNPFRYCGEYFDEETGLTYLRNRYYDSSTGTFMNEDPIRDGLNWYVYCNSNPVMFVDPWGLSMILSGTDEEKQDILDTLKSLTRDNLYYESDYLGNWIVNYESVEGDKWNVGTDLIRRIIDNDYDAIIKVDEFNGTKPFDLKAASTPGMGSGSVVYFNPKKEQAQPILTEYIKDGEVVRESKLPEIEISLGHELIHALRAINGNRIPYNDDTEMGYGSYTYINRHGAEITKNKRMEELATTGVRYVRPDGSIANADRWVTTENALRAEHGYGKRVEY